MLTKYWIKSGGYYSELKNEKNSIPLSSSFFFPDNKVF